MRKRTRKKSPKYDLSGKEFGYLYINHMEQDIVKDPRGSFFAICKCNLCGKDNIKIRECNIRKGKTTSCGCRRDYYMNRLGEKNAKFTGYKEIYGRYWANIKSSANRRDIPFDLTIEDAWQVFENQRKCCALTGLPITFGRNSKSTTSSLDRIDSSIGYTKENIQWTHKDINRIKSDLPQDYFIQLCSLVANLQIKQS